MNLFYAAHAYREAQGAGGTFPGSVDDVAALIDDACVRRPEAFREVSLERNAAGDGFLATVAHRRDDVVITVNEERLITEVCTGGEPRDAQ